jgi:hypothetical protein
MDYTYKWQFQPYVSWKGVSTNSAVPTFSRPLTGMESAQSGPSFSARPIKHWRKQLNPMNNVVSRGRAGIGMPSDIPGGSVYLGSKSTECIICTDNKISNSAGLKENIIRTNHIIQPVACDEFYDNVDNRVVCVACNPENNIIKSAITLLSKKYYSDTHAYLYSRCQTYNQKLSTNPVPGIEYINSQGQALYPSQCPDGPQVRLTQDCPEKCQPTSNKVVTTIYKPNNAQFAVQGAVSSSSRIDRLKYNTITKNGSSFRTAWGDAGANAGRYQGTSTAPYFLKSKYQKCVQKKRDGDHTICFYTPTGSVSHDHTGNDDTFKFYM